MYKIEKGIKRTPGVGRRGQSKYPLAQMKCGDSFMIPAGHIKYAAPVYTVATRLKVKIAVHKQPCGGWRVWRVK